MEVHDEERVDDNVLVGHFREEPGYEVAMAQDIDRQKLPGPQYAKAPSHQEKSGLASVHPAHRRAK